MANYGTVDGANTYFSARLGYEKWENFTPELKGKALVSATDRIDALAVAGKKTSDEQELKFPRDPDTDVPNDIIIATYEIAYALLDDRDPNLDFETLPTVSQGYSAIRETYDRSFVQEHVGNGIPSIRAWQLLKKYLLDAEAVDLCRVN